MNSFLERANQLKPELVRIRRTLHQAPELGLRLPKTSALVAEQLDRLGVSYRRLGESGIVACIGGKRGGKVFLLRGDMDALGMEEQSGLPFASQNGCAHTCGHDLHTTMLLGAAQLLKEQEDTLEGTVKLMFQPSEEDLKGAAFMLEAGVLESPRVDAAMAMHVFPGDMHAGELAWRAGPTLASTDLFRLTVTGKAGHGAIPQNAVDPLNIAAHILIALQELNAREVDPQDPLVLTICTLHGGELHNAFPDQAVMTGSIRAFSRENRKIARQRLVEICEGTAQVFRGSCRVEFLAQAPSVINDVPLAEELKQYAAQVVDRIIDLPRQMGSEDFAFVTEQVPSVFMGLGAGGADPIYHQGASHNPKVVWNEDALPLGAAIHATCAANWLAAHR